MVCPVAFLGLWHGGYMELCALAWKVDRMDLADAGALGAIGEVDALING